MKLWRTKFSGLPGEHVGAPSSLVSPVSPYEAQLFTNFESHPVPPESGARGKAMAQWGEDETEVGEIMDSFHDSVMFAITGRMSTGSPQAVALGTPLAVVHRRAASVGDDRGALHLDDLRAELTKHGQHAWSASGVGIHPSAAAASAALPFRAEWRAAGHHFGGMDASPLPPSVHYSGGGREQPREDENGKDDFFPGGTRAEREKVNHPGVNPRANRWFL